MHIRSLVLNHETWWQCMLLHGKFLILIQVLKLVDLSMKQMTAWNVQWSVLSAQAWWWETHLKMQIPIFKWNYQFFFYFHCNYGFIFHLYLYTSTKFLEPAGQLICINLTRLSAVIQRIKNTESKKCENSVKLVIDCDRPLGRSIHRSLEFHFLFWSIFCCWCFDQFFIVWTKWRSSMWMC